MFSYIIRFNWAAGHFDAAGPLLYTFLLDLILLYQKLNYKSICPAEFETDKFSCEVNFTLLDSFYLSYWIRFFRGESRKIFAGSSPGSYRKGGHMGKLSRRAGRPMGKKNFEGPTFCRRGGHMRPGPGCQRKRVAYGGCIRQCGLEGRSVVQVAQKECDFGKKDCAI